MQGKIVFEEHMAIVDTVAETKDFAGESASFDDFTKDILDLDNQRLEMMDRNGIELAILSLNAPAIQGILDCDQAVETARKANDAIKEAIDRHPGRYAGMAALPMQDPKAAAL